MITIIDYQAGNVGSINNMLKKIGYASKVTSSREEVAKAERIILPGVGSFDFGVSKLEELGLSEVLDEKKRRGTPILGICLGAQLMLQSSEEGNRTGLGWIKGVVKKFPTVRNGKKFTVPHMGWDRVEITKSSKLFTDVDQPSRFYFVHSYYIECDESADVLTTNEYSVNYHSSFEKENIIGVQFHPEKSHKFGKQVLKNFLERY